MNTRTPEQEAAIDAAVAHLEFLLKERRGTARGSNFKVIIRSAVVDAALAIVAEPKGVLPVRCDRNCRCPECCEARSPADDYNEFDHAPAFAS